MSKHPKGVVSSVLSIVVIVAAAGFLYYYFYSGPQDSRIRRDVDVLTIDFQSGEVHYVTKKKDENFPLTDPETGEKTLWEAYLCHDENIIFPARPGTPVMSCPFCGRGNVGIAAKEHKDHPVRI